MWGCINRSKHEQDGGNSSAIYTCENPGESKKNDKI